MLTFGQAVRQLARTPGAGPWRWCSISRRVSDGDSSASPARDDLDPVHEAVDRCALEQKAGRPLPKRGVDEVVQVVRRQHQHARRSDPRPPSTGWTRCRPGPASGCPSGTRPAAAGVRPREPARPSAASPSTSTPRDSSITRRPIRIISWSSTTTTLVTPAPRGHPCPHQEPSVVRRAGGQRPAEHRHPLAHADQTASPGAEPGGTTRTAGELHLHAVRHPSVAHLDPRPRRVLEGVGESLLHDAEQRQVEASGQALGASAHLQAARRSPSRGSLRPARGCRPRSAAARDRTPPARAAARASDRSRPAPPARSPGSRRARGRRRPRRAPAARAPLRPARPSR